MSWIRAIPAAIQLVSMLASEFKKIESAWTFHEYIKQMTAALQKAHQTKGDTSDVEALINGTVVPK